MAGVYISYPFCAQKCSYCNFASGVLPAEWESNYLAALETEIRAHPWNWRPETVYLGGGTPSRLGASALARILSAVPGTPWKEATIEAAPGGITGELAKAWRDTGITRVSLGVQSFVDGELRITGRRHTAEVVAAEFEILRGAGLREINVDLIAGLPKQTFASWKESLEWIERLAPPHVSVYMLEVDEDSRLGLEILHDGSRYGASSRPSDELTVEMYEYAVDRLAALGIERYEISNFARHGHASLHNLKYWRLEPYVGFGADAHSFDGKLRGQNADDVRVYVDRLQSGRGACIEQVEAQHDEERFFVGLRLTEGVHPNPTEWLRFDNAIRRFVDAGLLERSGDTLRLTRRGVLVSNEVFQEFVSA
jgi:oxygen-independent coproporphyrinogen III oxidase